MEENVIIVDVNSRCDAGVSRKYNTLRNTDETGKSIFSTWLDDAQATRGCVLVILEAGLAVFLYSSRYLAHQKEF